MKKISFVLILFICSFGAFAQNTSKLLSSYFDIKNALVNGQSAAAAEGVTAFSATLKSEAAFPLKSDLTKAITKMEKAKSLEKQREAFNNVSVILWKIVKSSDKTGQALYYQYCPMKKAYWLSKEKEIKNPYYGSSMLNCGKVVESKD